MTLVGVSLANLRSRRLRTVVSAFSVAVACALLTVAFSATERVRTALHGFDDRDLLVMSARSEETMPAAFVTQIRSEPSVESVDYILASGAQLPDDSGLLALYAVSNDYFARFPTSVFQCPPALHDAWVKERSAILVTADVLQRTPWKVGDTIVLTTDKGPVQVHLIGTTGGSMSLAVIMHHELYDALGSTHGEVMMVSVRARSDGDATNADLVRRLDASDPPVLVIPTRAYHDRVMAFSGLMPDLLFRIGLALALCTVLVITSNAFVTLRERRAELGALLVIGWRRSRVLLMVIGEFLASCGVAAAAGCGAVYALYHERGLHLGGYALQSVTVSPTVGLTVFAVIVAAGTIATFIPTVLVLRQRILEMLEPA